MPECAHVDSAHARTRTPPRGTCSPIQCARCSPIQRNAAWRCVFRMSVSRPANAAAHVARCVGAAGIGPRSRSGRHAERSRAGNPCIPAPLLHLVNGTRNHNLLCSHPARACNSNFLCSCRPAKRCLAHSHHAAVCSTCCNLRHAFRLPWSKLEIPIKESTTRDHALATAILANTAEDPASSAWPSSPLRRRAKARRRRSGRTAGRHASLGPGRQPWLQTHWRLHAKGFGCCCLGLKG